MCGRRQSLPTLPRVSAGFPDRVARTVPRLSGTGRTALPHRVELPEGRRHWVSTNDPAGHSLRVSRLAHLSPASSCTRRPTNTLFRALRGYANCRIRRIAASVIKARPLAAPRPCPIAPAPRGARGRGLGEPGAVRGGATRPRVLGAECQPCPDDLLDVSCDGLHSQSSPCPLVRQPNRRPNRGPRTTRWFIVLPLTATSSSPRLSAPASPIRN